MSTSCSQETTCLGRVWGLFNPLSWCKIPPGKGTYQIPKGASPRTYMKQVGPEQHRAGLSGMLYWAIRALIQD